MYHTLSCFVLKYAVLKLLIIYNFTSDLNNKYEHQPLPKTKIILFALFVAINLKRSKSALKQGIKSPCHSNLNRFLYPVYTSVSHGHFSLAVFVKYDVSQQGHVWFCGIADFAPLQQCSKTAKTECWSVLFPYDN